MWFEYHQTPKVHRDGCPQAFRIRTRVKIILYSLVAGMVAPTTVAMSVSHAL
jgi:hypothetical protein